MSFATSRAFSACRALFAPAKTAAKVSTTPKPKAEPKPKKPATATTSGGLKKPVPVSPRLKDFIGTSEASRIEAVKKIWDHIKEHNLQNPSNRKEILCDDKLKVLFDGREKVTFLEIGKLLSPHFIKTV